MRARAAGRRLKVTDLVAPAAVVALAAVIFTAAWVGTGDDAAGPEPSDAADDGSAALVATEESQGSFMTPCEHSHTGPDDPIVHPGHAGRSHQHEFFGATTTDASSTVGSLLAGGTTCRSVADHSAYWAPVLLADGEPVRPTYLAAYYRVPIGADAGRVTVPPNGLKMIAGDQHASGAQDPDVVRWTCGPVGDSSPTPRPCRAGTEPTLRLTFPPCWDGENLDAPDHRSHLAALDLDEGGCPDSHPVLIPELTLEVRYPDDGSLQAGELGLASGPPTGGHGDALLAWESDYIAGEVDSCLARNVRCDVVSEQGRLSVTIDAESEEGSRSPTG